MVGGGAVPVVAAARRRRYEVRHTGMGCRCAKVAHRYGDMVESWS